MATHEVWELERGFWLDGPKFYDDHMIAAAQMVFPDPVGILKGEAILKGLEEAPRWGTVDMEERSELSGGRHPGPRISRDRQTRRRTFLRRLVLEHLHLPRRSPEADVSSADTASLEPPTGTRPALCATRRAAAGLFNSNAS